MKSDQSEQPAAPLQVDTYFSLLCFSSATSGAAGDAASPPHHFAGSCLLQL